MRVQYLECACLIQIDSKMAYSSYFCSPDVLRTLCRVFSAPEPKAQVHYCDHALSVVSCLFFIFLTSPPKALNRIQRNLTGSKISTSSTRYVFFGPIGKTRWLPWPLIGWDIFNFSSETAKQNSTKLDRKQDLNVLYQGCVFRADQ